MVTMTHTTVTTEEAMPAISPPDSPEPFVGDGLWVGVGAELEVEVDVLD
jgi:hypothetical protein